MKISEINFKEHANKYGEIKCANYKADDSLTVMTTETELIRFKSNFIEKWGDCQVDFDPTRAWVFCFYHP